MDLRKYLYYLVSQIPPGRVSTYKALCDALGSKYALKFVLNELRRAPPNVPVHRVVKNDGEIGEHPWGKEYKKKLLEKEGIKFEGYRIKDFDKVFWNDYQTCQPLKVLREEQMRVVRECRLEDKFEKLEFFGGADLSYNEDLGICVVVVIDRDFNIVDEVILKDKVDFPYIPTFLAFREYPLIEKAYKKLKVKPDVLFVNGHGIAHPIKCGLATFTGVKLKIPTIGVTKKILVGKVVDGKIVYKGEVLGYELEKFGKKVYVSPGNFVCLESSRRISEDLWVKGNYPEPIRIADELSKTYKHA